MKRIPLTRGLWAIVDDEDYERLAAHKWMAATDRHGRVYARRWEANGDAPRFFVFMHREVAGVTDPALQVDHIDGHGLNNTRANLRSATNQQNAWNQRPHRRRSRPAERSSSHKGVSWYSNGWRARITADGKTHHLGRFGIEEEAAHAYNRAAQELFGEFARLNRIAA